MTVNTPLHAHLDSGSGGISYFWALAEDGKVDLAVYAFSTARSGNDYWWGGNSYTSGPKPLLHETEHPVFTGSQHRVEQTRKGLVPDGGTVSVLPEPVPASGEEAGRARATADRITALHTALAGLKPAAGAGKAALSRAVTGFLAAEGALSHEGIDVFSAQAETAESGLLDRAREILAAAGTAGTGAGRQTERAEGAVLMALQHGGQDVARTVAVALGRGPGDGPARTGQDRDGGTAVAAWRGQRLGELVIEVNRQLRELGVKRDRVNAKAVLKKLEELPAQWAGRSERAVAAEIAGRLANGGKGPLRLRGGMRSHGFPDEPPAPGSAEYESLRRLLETSDDALGEQEGPPLSVLDHGNLAAEQHLRTVEAAERQVSERGLRLVVPADGGGLMSSLAEVLHALYPASRPSAQEVSGLLADAMQADLVLAPEQRSLWPRRLDGPAERWYRSLVPGGVSWFGDAHRAQITELMRWASSQEDPASEIAVETAAQAFPWRTAVLHGYGPDDLYWEERAPAQGPSPALVRFHTGGSWAAAVPDADALLAAWGQPRITAEEHEALRWAGTGLTAAEQAGVVRSLRDMWTAAPAPAGPDHDGTPLPSGWDPAADTMDVDDPHRPGEEVASPSPDREERPADVAETDFNELFGSMDAEVGEPSFVLELPLPSSAPALPAPAGGHVQDPGTGSGERSSTAAEREDRSEEERRTNEVLERVRKLHDRGISAVRLAGALVASASVIERIIRGGSTLSAHYASAFSDPSLVPRLDKLEEIYLTNRPGKVLSPGEVSSAAAEIWARVRRLHESGMTADELVTILPISKKKISVHLESERALDANMATRLVAADVGLFLDGWEEKYRRQSQERPRRLREAPSARTPRGEDGAAAPAARRAQVARAGTGARSSIVAERAAAMAKLSQRERQAEEVLERVRKLHDRGIPIGGLAGALLVDHRALIKYLNSDARISEHYVPAFASPGVGPRLDNLERRLSTAQKRPRVDADDHSAIAADVWARVRRLHEGGVPINALADSLPFSEKKIREHLSSGDPLSADMSHRLVVADVGLFLDGLEEKYWERMSAMPQPLSQTSSTHDRRDRSTPLMQAPRVAATLAGLGLRAVPVSGQGDDFESALVVAAGLADETGAPLSAETVRERLVAELDDGASHVWWYLGDEARAGWAEGRRRGYAEIPSHHLPLVASQAFGLSLNVLHVGPDVARWETPPERSGDLRTASVVWTEPASWTAAVPDADALLAVRGVPKVMEHERAFLDRNAPALSEGQKAAVIWARRHLGDVDVRILTEAFRLHFPHAFQPHTAPPRPGTLDVTVPDLRRAVQAVATGHTTAAAPPSGGRGADAGVPYRPSAPAGDDETAAGVGDLLTLNPALTRSEAELWGSRFAEARRTMGKLPREAYRTAMQEAAGYMGGHRPVFGEDDKSRLHRRVHRAMVERIAFVLTRAHRDGESQPSQHAVHESSAMAKAFGTGRREGLPGGMPPAGGGEGEPAYITVLRRWPESAAQPGGRPSSLGGIDFAVARLSGGNDVLDALADIIEETGVWSAENAESAWRGRVENLHAAAKEYQWELIKEGRRRYIREVEGLAGLVSQMSQSGATEEHIARSVHAERRKIGVKYKNLTPPAKRQAIYDRNTMKYGDPLGPTIDWLRGRGKEWGDIIESASRTGGADLGLGKGQI